MAVIATAEVRVIADTSRFLSNLRRQLRGAFGQAGAQSAQRFTQEFGRNISGELTDVLRQSTQRATRGMRGAGQTAATAFSAGFSTSVDRISTEALSSLRTQTLINGARVQGGETADAFVSGMRSRLDTRLAREAQEILAPFHLIPPALTRIGNEAGNAFIGDFFTSSTRSRLRIAAEEVIGAIDERIAAASSSLRDRGNNVMRDFASGLRRGQAEVAAAAEAAAAEAAEQFREALSPAPSAFVTDFLDGVDQRQAQLNLQMRRAGIDAFTSFRDGVEQAQQRLSTGINPIRMQRDGDAAAEGLLTGFRRRLNTSIAQVSLRFGRNLRTSLVSSASDTGSRFGAAFEASLTNRANRAGTSFLNLIRRALGRDTEQLGEESGSRLGRAFGRGLTRSISVLTIGLRGLGQALSAISLRPLQGLAGIMREATSEMVSMAGQALLVLGLLEALSGVLFALPAAVSVLGAGIATAAVAFQGFGAAVGAAFDDLDAFNEAIEDLAPSAQAVAREFRAIAPALTDLRIDVQQALFAQLEGTITDVAANLIGPLSRGMTLAASALGGLVSQIGEFLAEAATADTVSSTFETLAAIFDALAQSAQPFLQGMRALVDEFLPRIADVAGPLAGVGEAFRNWTKEIISSGQAMEAFEFALDTFSALGGIITDLAGIFQAMFSAAALAGVDALGAIGEALEVIRATFESFEGQAALANVFAAISDAVTALAPVFATLITQLGLVFPIIGQIAQALGPSLSVVLEGLGQALLALGPGVIAVFDGIALAAEAIAPALQPLGEAIGSLLTAIAPLLPVIGELVAIVVQLGAEIISVLASAIMPIAEAIASALLPILPQLSDLFSRIVEAVAPLIEVLGAGLASVIQTLLPPILELVIALADALMPIFEALVPVITPLLEIVFQLAEMIGALLVPVISLLLPLIEVLAPLFELVGVVLAPLLELFSAILEPITSLVVMIAELLTPVIQFLAEIIGAIISVALVPLTAAFEWLGGILADHVIPWFEASVVVLQMFWENAVKPLIDWIRDLASTVSDRFGTIRDTVSTVTGAIDSAIQGTISWFSDLASSISEYISSAVDTLSSFGDTVGNVLGAVGDFFSDAASTVSSAVESIIGWVQNAIDTVANFDIGSLNPFADGGIVTRPTAALIGEAGKEVVIPLTRPQRAVELAQQSGLLDLLAAHGGIGQNSAPAGPPIEMHVHSGVADPEQVARRAMRLMERRMGPRGLERV